MHKCCDIFDVHLFTDDTNLLYMEKSLTSLASVVNNEVKNVTKWRIANKLTLITKKSNLVIFCPYQRNLNETIDLKMFDNSTNYLNYNSAVYVKNIMIMNLYSAKTIEEYSKALYIKLKLKFKIPKN